ncbi:MAG: U32 family peptidase, partial [Clostridia bacterium]
SIMSISAVKLMENLGAQRIVTAREMTLSETKFICENSGTEIEVFVHGALCMCISGQCYFSATLGSRSGNRGRCAQPCRLPFMAKSGNGYDLSLKDLSYIDKIQNLSEIGVTSAKIEGRMKRPEYVAASVKSAQSMRDNSYIDATLSDNLQSVFSRSGFTKGYLDDKIDMTMFGTRTKEDVTKGSSAVLSSLHEIYKNELQKVLINIEFSAFVDKFPVIKITDNKQNFVEITGEKACQQAINRALSEDDLKPRLAKLGGTTYFAENVTVKTDGKSSLPVSAINALRREAIAQLSVLRAKAEPIKFSFEKEEILHRKSENLSLRAEFTSLSQVPENTDIFEFIYLPLDAPLEHFQHLLGRKSKLGAVLPSAVFGDDTKIFKKAKFLLENGVEFFACPNLYAIEIVKKIGGHIHGKFSLNIFNSYSAKQFEMLGAESFELSCELKESEIKNIKSTAKRGFMVYGRQTLMTVRNCPQKRNSRSCASCSGHEVLTDRKNIQFPVLCSQYRNDGKNFGCLSQYSKIINSVPVFLLDRMTEIENLDFGVLSFTVENSVEINRILSDFKNIKNTVKPCTYGLFHRGVI